MTTALEQELVSRFPSLYHPNFGFECGDGWYHLLLDLSQKLEEEILKHPKDSRGNYQATQVKEKFAGLRFYMSSSTNEMENIIANAEDQAEKTCEVCGNPGKVETGRHWLKTRCVDHWQGSEPYNKTKEE